MHWYSQVGTPVVILKSVNYDPERKVFSLTIAQNHSKLDSLGPLLIPIEMGLIDKSTKLEIDLDQCEVTSYRSRDRGDCTRRNNKNSVLWLTEQEQTFEIHNVQSSNVFLSLLRNFSAPVLLQYEPAIQPTSIDLVFQMSYDTNDFNRWESCQTLSTNVILDIMNNQSVTNKDIPTLDVPQPFIQAYKNVITNFLRGDKSAQVLYAILYYTIEC